MRLEFEALCAAAVSKNGSQFVLLRFHPSGQGHLMGELPKDIGLIERDTLYRVIIEKVGPSDGQP